MEYVKRYIISKMIQTGEYRSGKPESVAGAIIYLVKKYGVDIYTDYELGQTITEHDEDYKKFGTTFNSYDVSRILGCGCGDIEITEEQKQNRATIKGELNVI